MYADGYYHGSFDFEFQCENFCTDENHFDVFYEGYLQGIREGGVGLFEKIIQAACYRICPGQFINRERDQPHGEYETVAHIRIARNAYIE